MKINIALALSESGYDFIAAEAEDSDGYNYDRQVEQAKFYYDDIRHIDVELSDERIAALFEDEC